MIDQEQVLDNLFDGLYTVTRNRKITYWNRAAEELTGYGAAEMIGTHCYDSPLKHVDREGRDLCNDGCPLSWAIAHRCRHEDEIFLHHRDGHRVPINVRVSPLYDADGEVIGASELFRGANHADLLAEQVEELKALAMLDSLTGLANRRFAEEQIVQYLHEMKRYSLKVGAALFAIDGFDVLAQDSTDQMQQLAARTLRSNCRPLDLVARLDEGLFLGLFRNVTSNSLHATCEKLRLLFAKSYLDQQGQNLAGTLSAGGRCLKEEDSCDTLLRDCHRQLEECRKQGGNRTAVGIRFVTA